MDKAGVVVVMAAGNGGYNKITGKPDFYQSAKTPVNLATGESPYINVGATYHDGSIAEFTTPPGSGPGGSGQGSDSDDLSISIWAQGVNVWTCTPRNVLYPMSYRSGTSFAAPMVVSLLKLTPPPFSSCASRTSLFHDLIQEHVRQRDC